MDVFRAMQGVGMGAAIVSRPIQRSLRHMLTADRSRYALPTVSHSTCHESLQRQPSALGILGTSFIPGRAVTSWAFAIFAGGAPIGAGVGFVLGGV